MHKTHQLFLAGLLGLGLTACATTPNNTLAIQKPNNQFEVTALGKSALVAKNNAISEANRTCGSRSIPVVVDEQSTYNGALKGVVDDQTGQLIHAATKVLGNLSGSTRSLNSDEDYQSVLTFYCKAR